MNFNIYEQAELMTTARRMTGRNDLVAVSQPWPEALLALLGYGDEPGNHYEIRDANGNILLDLFQRWGRNPDAPKYSADYDKWTWRWQALIGHWSEARNTSKEHELPVPALREAIEIANRNHTESSL